MSEKKPRLQAVIEAVAETPAAIDVSVRYLLEDPRQRETLLTQRYRFKREEYGGEEIDWKKLEGDVRPYMKAQIKVLRKGLKPHPLLGIIEEEEPEPKGK